MDQSPPILAMIVAIAENGVIGRYGDLPWRLSSDLRTFRRVTMGKPVIMGRKTFASLPKPLDGRDTVVITRNQGFTAPDVIAVHSLAEALALAQECAARRNADEIFVIGGADIFRQALPLARRMYLTRVHAAPEGDVTFPEIDWNEWHVVNSQSYPIGPKDAFPFTFSVLERP